MTLDDKFVSKKFNKFSCINCDYNTSRKSQYDRHLLTVKHKTIMGELLLNDIKVPKGSKTYNCECGNKYKHRQGLWKHKQICQDKEQVELEDYDKLPNINQLNNCFFELLKQNNEFKELILEQNKQISEQNKQIMELSSKNNNNITNNSINSYNKTFNLQVFLNEKCKDALNINDFVNSLNLSLADLENFGENGFVDGISKIFVKGLKNLDIYKRPIHCSDLKRETMHVKEQTGWEKDNENKDRLKKVVKMIAHKNMLKIGDWKQANPQHKNSDSKKNDQYLKMLIGTAGPTNKDDEIRYYEKIIKNIAKEVTIDKVI